MSGVSIGYFSGKIRLSGSPPYNSPNSAQSDPPQANTPRKLLPFPSDEATNAKADEDLRRAYSTGSMNRAIRVRPEKAKTDQFIKQAEKSSTSKALTRTYPSWLDRILRLPGNTRADASVKRQILFDRIADFEDPNPYRVNPKKAVSAYLVIKDLLRSPDVRAMLNEPDEHGNYPLDYAATVNRPFMMKLLVDHGATRVKSWESWAPLKPPPSENGYFRIDSEAFKQKKATLHQNPRFRHFLELIKENPKLAEIRDEKGDTFLHYLLKDDIAEGFYGQFDRSELDQIPAIQRRNDEWQRTLKAILDSGLRLNLKNSAGESPLSMLDGLDILFPQTIDALKRAGARTQLLPRPGLIID